MKKVLIDLIEKYSKMGHFYTSYPPEIRWSNKFSHEDYCDSLGYLASKNEPISLYIHFPFCNSKCFYCLCRTHTAIGNESGINIFFEHLLKEIKLLKSEFDKNSFIPYFKELHLGGGSPSMMTKEQFKTLLTNLKTIINFEKLEEFNLEIDPRTVDIDKIKFFQEMGVNRVSLGIQDFDERVQKAVNRIHSFESVKGLLTPEIRKGFKSINFDLIYGLPQQTLDSLKKTIQRVIELSPDRVCLYGYVHKPEIHEIQKLIKESELPNQSDRIEMFMQSREMLLNAGYKHIGIEHFAKPEDELAKALDKKTVSRNFNGYNPGRASHLIGMGPSGSGRFAIFYAQNAFTSAEYYSFLDKDKFPIIKGYKMDNDDIIRREVIDSLMCNCYLDFSKIENKFGIKFDDYFKKELEMLKAFSDDKIIDIKDRILVITDLGRVFLPPVCSVFDKFLER